MAYLHEEQQLFKEAIDLVVSKTGISSEVVEKDYYVTMILRELSKKLDFIVFKGGTSLSKCHKAINRFSEDIDITVDTAISQGKKKKVKDALKEVAEMLRLDILNIEETQSRRDYNCYNIAYRSVLPTVADYLKSTVLLETSYMVVSFPVEEMEVSNYIGEMMLEEAPESIEEFCLEPFKMKVQKLDRTLVDKIFAICDYYLQDKVKQHSRHLYDIYKLSPLVEKDDSFKELIEKVRAERAKSIVCLSAKEEISVAEILDKIIRENAYKSDYETLTRQLLGEDVVYETAILTLKEITESGLFN